MSTLNGKVAVVTGGGRGVGRGISLALAAAGAQVVVNDFFKDSEGAAADRTADEITSAGGTALANYGDVSTFAGGAAIVDAAVERFGRIDILVMCAGNFGPVPTLDVTEDHWDLTMSVHLKGHFACSQAAARHMVEQGDGGRIITFASRGAFYMTQPAYAAAKAGIMGLTTALAGDLGKHGITANCILPSAGTQLFPGNDPRARTFGGMPASRSLDPEDIAPIVTYLAGDDAKDITARFFYASGGDICAFAQPLAVRGGSNTYLRKDGRWTPEELGELLPGVLGVGQ
ncbi:SDR family NAD(P)-dependent oxidoreductase [Streptomyces sp. NPDC058457]|uniref:SDR family NAD(P)-dependent oxidoreductase n=1 Tax=Streptomyces sp. NPDC058457 TaxID=3346507 RepID=UPI003657CD40